MVHRTVKEIFNRINQDPDNDYTVQMNFLQIYMETIQDLLQPENKNLLIREDTESGVYISGICSKPIKEPTECFKIYREGELNRVTALTKMVRNYLVELLNHELECHVKQKSLMFNS